MRDLLRRRAFLIGLMLVGLVIAGALLANWLAPFDPIGATTATDLARPRLSIRSALTGSAATCSAAFCSVPGSPADRHRGGGALGLAGATAFLAAGGRRGVDRSLTRIMEGLMAFPGLLLAIRPVGDAGPK